MYNVHSTSTALATDPDSATPRHAFRPSVRAPSFVHVLSPSVTPDRRSRAGVQRVRCLDAIYRVCAYVAVPVTETQTTTKTTSCVRARATYLWI